MDNGQVFLLFRLHEITDGKWCGAGKPYPVPEGWSALAVSGGMPGFIERKRVWDEWPCSGTVPNPGPFFSNAHPEVIARVAWALMGTGGRLYPIFKTWKDNARDCGADVPEWPYRTWDILFSPKLLSRQAAASMPWARGFFTCWSNGTALGFWGDPEKLEKRVSRDADLLPFRILNDEVLPTAVETWDQKMEEAHPYLHACIEEHGYDWLLDNVPLILRPCGWEGEDGVFLTKQMSLDEMIQAIRKELGGEMRILEFDEPEIWRKWPGCGKEQKLEIRG